MLFFPLKSTLEELSEEKFKVEIFPRRIKLSTLLGHCSASFFCCEVRRTQKEQLIKLSYWTENIAALKKMKNSFHDLLEK